MSSIFDELPEAGEPSSRVAFAGNRLDRQSENRAADCLDKALADARAAIFAIAGGKLVSGPEGSLFEAGRLHAIKPDFDNAVLLGFDATGAPRLAVPVGADPDAMPDGYEALPLRAVYTHALLDPDNLGQMAQGASLVAWNLANRHCGCCGARTHNEAGGYRRKCTACGHTAFPRTDPVVIMLAVDVAGDRCLLGRSPHFPPGMYSCLAGFLEPGETMESAVRRETLEEAGITIGRVRYLASQPWPLPHTIMIGFYAEATNFDIDRDATELEDCRWFTREEAAKLLQRLPDELTTAPEGAIANLLLRDWVSRTPA